MKRASPAAPNSWPAYLATASRRMRRCSSSASLYCSAPSSASRDVESSMSLKRRVMVPVGLLVMGWHPRSRSAPGVGQRHVFVEDCDVACVTEHPSALLARELGHDADTLQMHQGFVDRCRSELGCACQRRGRGERLTLKGAMDFQRRRRGAAKAFDATAVGGSEF